MGRVQHLERKGRVQRGLRIEDGRPQDIKAEQVLLQLSSQGRDQYLTERHGQRLCRCERLPPTSLSAAPTRRLVA